MDFLTKAALKRRWHSQVVTYRVTQLAFVAAGGVLREREDAVTC